MQTMRAFSWCLVALSLGGSTACKNGHTAPAHKQPDFAADKDVVALVNGQPVYAEEVAFKARSRSHRPEAKEDDKQQTLESVIDQELISQKAIALGLDQDPDYRKSLHQMEAAVNDTRRRALIDLYFRRQIADKVEVSEAEAKAYFDEHAASLRTEYHVLQILRRSEAAIAETTEALAQPGASFEDVAKAGFGALAPGDSKPWDLGFLPWQQLPEQWRTTLGELKPGEVSPVIHGQKDRFWLIKLVEKRENPGVTFESMKTGLIAELKARKTEALRDKAEHDLRGSARISYPNPIPEDSEP